MAHFKRSVQRTEKCGLSTGCVCVLYNSLDDVYAQVCKVFLSERSRERFFVVFRSLFATGG